MSPTLVISTALPQVIGLGVAVAIGQRRVIARRMPDSAAEWRALRVRDRMRIQWAVARGNAVGEARLATLAVAVARMRAALWAQLSGTTYVVFGLVGVVLVVVDFVSLRAEDGGAYGGFIALGILVEAITAPGRAARLVRAEQRNQRLAATI